MPLILLAVAAAAQAVPCPASITVPAGTVMTFETIAPLSSKTSVKGDMVSLQLAADVSIDGRVALTKGTAAVGQVSDARATGGLGVDGRLILKPLYLRSGAHVVRLAGVNAKDGGVTAGGVIGLAVLPALSGRSAALPAGSQVSARVERSVELQPACRAAAPAQ